MQIIEGDDLRAKCAAHGNVATVTFAIIRHYNLMTVVDENVEHRGFVEWNMDAFNLSHGETLDVVTLKRIRDIYKANILPISIRLSMPTSISSNIVCFTAVEIAHRKKLEQSIERAAKRCIDWTPGPRANVGADDTQLLKARDDFSPSHFFNPTR